MTPAVRGPPILNDALKVDANTSRFTGMVPVIAPPLSVRTDDAE